VAGIPFNPRHTHYHLTPSPPSTDHKTPTAPDNECVKCVQGRATAAIDDRYEGGWGAAGGGEATQDGGVMRAYAAEIQKQVHRHTPTNKSIHTVAATMMGVIFKSLSNKLNSIFE